jgi:hypothetical protein
VLVLSGEPAGTRTQGPRLKSSIQWFLTSARYCKGFPKFSCNAEMLGHSIGSVPSHPFRSIPAQFCHKIHHSGSTHKIEGVGSWFVGCIRHYRLGYPDRLLGVVLTRLGLRHHPPVTVNSVSCGMCSGSLSLYGTWVGKEVPMVPPILPRARIPAISSEGEG